MNAVQHESEISAATQIAEAAKAMSWLLPNVLSTPAERFEEGFTAGRSVRIKDLLTKYFYRDEHLCFQLLVLADNGEKLFFKEFTDYSSCKRAHEELEKLKAQGAPIRLPERMSLMELVA